MGGSTLPIGTIDQDHLIPTGGFTLRTSNSHWHCQLNQLFKFLYKNL